MVQAAQDVFAHIRAHPQREFIVRISAVEVYNELVKDLLTGSSAALKVSKAGLRAASAACSAAHCLVGTTSTCPLWPWGRGCRHGTAAEQCACSSTDDPFLPCLFLQLLDDPRLGTVAEGLTHEGVHCAEQLAELLQRVNERRQVGMRWRCCSTNG